MTYRELPDSIARLEEDLQRAWEEEDTFRRSLEARRDAPEFVFYEGPPTANGRPGVHHIMARTLKDTFARYRSMTGHHVTRIAGWDTHGLPVELEAEKQLGISGKPEIEELGIAEFNRVCRENIFTYKDEWERLSRRIGYWLDYDRAYITCSRDYIESVWWALARIEEKGLLYRGYRIVPYCPRCGTGLSSHEVAQGYRRVADPSVTVKFPLLDDPDEARVLSWTTTPWTLPGNLALAVGEDIEYVRVRVLGRREAADARGAAPSASPPPEETDAEAGPRDAGAPDAERPAAVAGAGPEPDLIPDLAGDGARSAAGREVAEEVGEPEPGAVPGEVLILARDRLDQVLRHRVEVLETLRGRDLVGRRYRPPFPGAVDVEQSVSGETSGEAAQDADAAWRIHAADFVSTEEGTGVVHTAVMYGEDDFELGRRLGLPMQHTVDEDGRFVDRLPEGLAGRRVKDPETERRIRAHLEERDALYRLETYEHSYPHCWRCDHPLLYMARDSWYVETTAVKDRLLENNASVDWHPPEIGRGRMGEWLENNVDWALSRDRYWGTPLPIWECSETRDHREVLGSFDALASRAGGLPEDFDPHRPEIDRPEWPCPEEGCEGIMRRIPQVADAWFDSGSMPFAQWHYPFENEGAFQRHFPADFIAEGVDQTRGWFYSLLALATILFDETAYRAVVVNDLILDAEGQKMSKSRGNVVDPWEAIAEYGADAIRTYLVSSSNPWLPKRWDPEGIREVDRKLFSTLRNTYRFFAMYANLEGWSHTDEEAGQATAGRPGEERGVLDRWLLSRLDTLGGALRGDLDHYDVTRAARRITSFVVDELSNWYVRRSRDRFWATGPDPVSPADTADAFATLREALVTTAGWLAPVAPFHADWVHRALTGSSVHLADFPTDRGRSDPSLERAMEDARQLAALGRAAREEAGIRVRQPLRELQAVVPGGRRLPPELVELLRSELNVKQVVFLSDSGEITRLSAKPNFGSLGPRFGARTPDVARAVTELEASAVRTLKRGEEVSVRVDGETVSIRPEDVTVLEEATGDLVVGSDRGYLAALDRTVDEELRTEGLARELVSRIQRLRRDAGLRVADRIRLAISGAESLERAAERHRDYIAGETLARELIVGDGRVSDLPHREEVEIDGDRVTLGVEPLGG